MKFLQATLKENLLFTSLVGVFILTAISFFTFVPLWDGYQFIQQCYIPAASSIKLDCALHSSLFNNLLFGVVQKIHLGDPILVYSENLTLGIIGIVFFYRLLKDFFGNRISNSERALITFLFGFQPVFLSQIVQPSLDFMLPIYAVILVFFLMRNNYLAAAILGLMLEFTKETGFMVYGVCVCLYFIVFAGLGRRKELITHYRETFAALLIPIISFLYYLHYYPTQAKPQWSTTSSIFVKMFQLNPTDSFFMAQFKEAAIINFYWIVTLMILLGVAAYIYKNAKERLDLNNLRPIELNIIYIYLCAVSILWFLTRIVFFYNPRYMLPWVPFFILAFASVYAFFRMKVLRITALSMIVLLIYISAFRTIDPVSKAVFPTFTFGEHTMLRPEEIARDTLVYNFEFTEFHYIAQKAVRTFGLDKNYVMSGPLTWYEFADFATYDKETQHRTIIGPQSNPRAVLVNIQSDKHAVADTKIRDLYFIFLPVTYGEDTIGTLSSAFTAVGTTTIEDRGYAIDVIHYERK